MRWRKHSHHRWIRWLLALADGYGVNAGLVERWRWEREP
jgi:hypothetical protein